MQQDQNDDQNYTNNVRVLKLVYFFFTLQKTTISTNGIESINKFEQRSVKSQIIQNKIKHGRNKLLTK